MEAQRGERGNNEGRVGRVTIKAFNNGSLYLQAIYELPTTFTFITPFLLTVSKMFFGHDNARDSFK